MRTWAYSWLVRTHMRTGDEVKAKNALAKAEGVRDASDDAKAHTLMVLAQYDILKEEYESAARNLKDAFASAQEKGQARPAQRLCCAMPARGRRQEVPLNAFKRWRTCGGRIMSGSFKGTFNKR